MPLVLSRDPLVRAVWAFAVLCLVIIILMAGKPSFTNASRPPRGTGSAVLEIQFPRSVGDVDLILGEAPSPDREVMRLKLYLDFAFIAAYVGLFVSLGMLVARGPSAWARIAGAAGALCGAAAGVFDVLENRATLAILDVPLLSTTTAMMNAIRRASTAKWTLAAIAILVLSLGGITRHRAGTVGSGRLPWKLKS